MNEKELRSQLERAKELYSDLIKELPNNISSEEVTYRTRILTEEIFIKLRTFLDKCIHYYINKNSLSIDLSKVYFPISKTKEDFDRVINRYGLNELKTNNSEFFNLILHFQPFSSKDREILSILQEKGSKEKHQFLIKEKKEVSHARTEFKSPNGSISWSPKNVKFGGKIEMFDVPINLETQEPSYIPSTHKLIKNYEISVKLSDKNLEVSSLCNSLIKLVEDIFNKIINLK